MKTLPSGMQADLDSKTTTHCHCWLIVRNDGSSMGFTDHDRDLVFLSTTFEAASGFTASALQQTTGFNVDNLEALGSLSSSRITENDISSGVYDNASITVFRVDWTNVTKRFILLKGNIGEVTRGQLSFKAEVRGLMHALNQEVGKTYNKTCSADFGDAKCGKSISDPTYSTTGTVLTVLSNRQFTTTSASVLAFANTWFNGGKLTWTSGLNNGKSMEIKSHSKGVSNVYLDLWELMPYNINIGDTFSLLVGCDKTIETCFKRFNNVANFRGFPRMPGSDAVNQLVGAKDLNDGSSWYT